MTSLTQRKPAARERSKTTTAQLSDILPDVSPDAGRNETLTNLAPQTEVQEAPIAASLVSPGVLPFSGFFDGIDDAFAFGWAFNPNNPAEKLSVEVLCDDQVIARGAADLFRSDLLEANIGDGWHQFRIRLPRRLCNGMAHTLHVRFASTLADLAHSPKIHRYVVDELPPVLDAQLAAEEFRQGRLSFDAKNWLVAETRFKESVRLNGRDPLTLWMLGRTIDKIGRTWEATEAVGKAVALDPRHASWHFLHGILLEKMSRLEEAEISFQAAVTLKPDVSDSHYRLGFILEKLGKTRAAERAYIYAVELDPTDLGRRFGPGAYHANRGLWPAAAAAYEAETASNPDSAELYYRLGLSYDRCYRWMDAAHAYEKAIVRDTTLAHWHYRLGFVLERAQEWDRAAQSYRAALARSDNHNDQWFFRLGYVLNQAGRHADACEAYRWTRLLGRPQGVETKTYEAEKGFQVSTQYNEYFETLPLLANTVLYESFHGASISCSPYALFKHLLVRPDFAGWTHVWVINEKEKIPAKYKRVPNVIFITRGSDLYLRYLCSASHLINNVSFPEYYMRKAGQTYLNTWHGTPLKTLGKDIKAPFLDHKNVARNFLHTTHLISPNRHTSEVMLDRYDIRGIYAGKIAETGYPRVDLTMNMNGESPSADLYTRLKITPGRKLILYAPTWRGTSGKAAFDSAKLTKDLARLADLDAVLLFRGHHMTEKLLAGNLDSVAVVPADIDTNELLGIVDILVTDYSSIYFDFLVTGKPIIHYVYDHAEYVEERGLYFPVEQMPGIVCTNIIEVKLALKENLREQSEPGLIYLDAVRNFAAHDDGHASQRVADFVFAGATADVLETSDGRQAILFFEGPFIPNGINTSFLNLLASLDQDIYRPVIAVDPGNISPYPDRMEQFDSVRDIAAVIGRTGRMNVSAEERWVIDKYNSQYAHASQEMRTIYSTAYKREFQRMFGDANFAAHVNFEGYSQFWSSLFAFGPRANNSIFLHNDMFGEWKMRFPYLQSVLGLYESYEKLFSVSELTRDLNRGTLPQYFGVGEAKFDFCINTIAADKVRERSLCMTDHPVLSPDRVPQPTRFVTIGRMSPEKDHRKLIDAFESIHHTHPNTELWIIGDGPLRHELAAQIAHYELDGSVHLLGQQGNPFPFLHAADCFILSSNHEGQPMVLLESVILGKPVIATDIAGSRSVLGDDYGLLVDNSAEGLAEGMTRFIQGGLEFKPFDANKYQVRAMAMFSQKVVQQYR